MHANHTNQSRTAAHTHRGTDHSRRSLAALLLATAASGDVQFPADAGVIDVAAFGAVPDDGLDDTAAIQAALDANPSGNKIFFFADGVYDISGTLAPALCVGLGKACDLAGAEFEKEADRLEALRDRFLDRIRAVVPESEVNGPRRERLAGNLSITIPGVDGEELMAALDGVSGSSGSACSSGARGASHVLKAIGRDPAAREATLRIGFGRFTTEEEVDTAAEILAAAGVRLRGGERRAAG